MAKDEVEWMAVDGRGHGRRGGRTAVSVHGFIKKSILLSPETNEALRTKAFAERRSEAEIVREALDGALGLPRESPEE